MGKTNNYQIAGTLTVTTTGTINNLDVKGYSTLQMGNSTDATITGIAAGYAGQHLTIISGGAGNVFLSHENISSSAANRLWNTVQSSSTPLKALRGKAQYVYQDGLDRWVLVKHEQGGWIDVAYASGNFTASSGTWTVDSGDQTTFSYWLEDATLHVALSLNTTSVSATPGTLNVAIPNGFTTPTDTRMPSFTQDNGAAVGTGMLRVAGGPGTAIFCYKDPAGTNWSVATNTTSLNGTLLFPVN